MTRERAIEVIRAEYNANRISPSSMRKPISIILEQEPCDAVSREAVCEIISDIRDCISVEGYWAILERLKKLQPVTQKPETVTEFADRCRECGARYGKYRKEARRWKNKWLKSQKSGKWIKIPKYGKWKCSKCDTEFRFTFKEHDYCPNCGAKMKSEV